MPEDEKIFGELGGTELGEPDPTAAPAEKEGEPGVNPEENVPFNEHPRWKEVYGQAQLVPQLKKELEELKAKIGQAPPQADNPQNQWEPKTWDEVLQRAVSAMEARLTEAQEQMSKANLEADNALDQMLTQLKTEKGEFDEKALLNTALKYGIEDLNKAYEIMQMQSEAEKRGEKMALKKAAASKISSSKKTEGGAKQQTPYQNLKRRSLDDIVADATERLQS